MLVNKIKQLYPELNPFEYLDRLEYRSVDQIIYQLTKSDRITATRILTSIPHELAMLILTGIIETMAVPDVLSEQTITSLERIIDIGQERNFLIDETSLNTRSRRRYEEVDGEFQWIRPQEWTEESIAQLYQKLQTDQSIGLYGYLSSGDLYIYNLKEKEYLDDLKRTARNCVTIDRSDLKTMLHTISPVHQLTENRQELCKSIETVLGERRLDPLPTSLLVDESVHKALREYIKNKKKMEKGAPKQRVERKPKTEVSGKPKEKKQKKKDFSVGEEE
jgi:hypothetical protein